MSHYKNDFKCKTEELRFSWRCLMHNYNCSVLLVFWFLEHTLLVWLVLQFYSDCFLCKTEAHQFIVVLFLILFWFCILSFYALYLLYLNKYAPFEKKWNFTTENPIASRFFFTFITFTQSMQVFQLNTAQSKCFGAYLKAKFVLLGVTLSFFPSSLCRFMSRCFTPHLFM